MLEPCLHLPESNGLTVFPDCGSDLPLASLNPSLGAVSQLTNSKLYKSCRPVKHFIKMECRSLAIVIVGNHEFDRGGRRPCRRGQAAPGRQPAEVTSSDIEVEEENRRKDAGFPRHLPPPAP